MGIARELTVAQIWAALSTVGLILIGWSKGWKIVFGTDFGSDLKKGFPLIQKLLFKGAIFRKELLDSMKELQQEIKDVKKQVYFNGGRSIPDSTMRLEIAVKKLADDIIHLKALRDISDRFDTVMRFRYHPEKGCTLINEAFLKGFGHYEGRVLGFNYEELVHPDDITDMRLKWNKATNNLTEFRDTQLIRDSLNNYHKCELMAKPVIDSGGLLIEYSGVIEIIHH